MSKPSEIKSEIIRLSKLMENKGLVNTIEGNLSIIDRDSGLIYITPSACRKLDLTEDMIAVMKEDEQIGGNIKASSEYQLHKIALQSRPDCSGAIHLHAPYLTAYAFCGMNIKLRCSTTFGLIGGSEIPCLPYGQPGTKNIANGITNALADHDVLLLKNHGVICVDKTLDHACAVIESLEEVMKIMAITKQIGLSPIDIPEDEYSKIIGGATITDTYK